jgi:hypothetical protein
MPGSHDGDRIVIRCADSGVLQQERIMMSLAGKKIVLGVSGGIAAYKTPELVRRLRDRGADVRVAMTEAAKAFITPLSLQAVSGYPVSDSLLDPAAEAAMGHIELGKWADLVILAPATADLNRPRRGRYGQRSGFDDLPRDPSPVAVARHESADVSRSRHSIISRYSPHAACCSGAGQR